MPKAAPGETLHPGIEPILSQLGILDQVLAAGFPRHRGLFLDHHGRREFYPYGADAAGCWLGFQADRRILHRLLQKAAVDAGATLVRNARPESVLAEENRVTGVLVNGDRLRATWTIDATGRQAWLARELGLRVVRRSPPIGVRFGWREEQSTILKGHPLFAHVTLTRSERSPIAALVTEMLEDLPL